MAAHGGAEPSRELKREALMARIAATLVGRDRELGLVASFLDQAATEGGAFLFTGEPGAGKTAILDAAAALDTFQRLGARPWQLRASHELRAAGARPPAAVTTAVFSPLDREIAELAASGLTNKQIGERLHLSHRTVGARLYQIFPRLGITSRAALRDALDGLQA